MTLVWGGMRCITDRPAVIMRTQVASQDTSAAVSGLEPGRTYYFAARACEQNGTNCSGFSNEVVVPAVASTNLALNRPVLVSSIEGGTYVAANAVDGQLGTRWSSQFSDPQWYRVDLGGAYAIDRVVLRWETAAARAYQIQVSADGATWSTVYSTSSGDGGVDDIALSAVTARYVRMYGTQRLTPYGYSLWEFEVYGEAAAPPQLTTLEVTPATATVVAGGSQQYSALGRDQYGAEMAGVVVNWTVSGGGSIDAASGLFTAATVGGPFTVTATSGGVTGTASVTVEAASANTNLALNRPVLASSIEGSAYVAANAVDGQLGTRWSSRVLRPAVVPGRPGRRLRDRSGGVALGDGGGARLPDPGLCGRCDLEHGLQHEQRGWRRGRHRAQRGDCALRADVWNPAAHLLRLLPVGV